MSGEKEMRPFEDANVDKVIELLAELGYDIPKASLCVEEDPKGGYISTINLVATKRF